MKDKNGKQEDLAVKNLIDISTLKDHQQFTTERIDKQLKDMSTNIKNFKVDIDMFKESFNEKFNTFTQKVKSDNLVFILWLLGTVGMSLLISLFNINNYFKDVNENIHILEKKVIIKQYTNEQEKCEK